MKPITIVISYWDKHTNDMSIAFIYPDNNNTSSGEVMHSLFDSICSNDYPEDLTQFPLRTFMKYIGDR
jgi:hypothetical protein